MSKSIVLVSLLVASIAHAEPVQYVQTTVLVGGAAPVDGPNAVLAVDGGYRLGTSHAWLHGVAAYGPAADDQGGGDNAYVRGGIEGRVCTGSGIACVMGGIDVGGQRGTWKSSSADERESATALVLVPRIGVEAGGDHVRARLGLELSQGLIRHDVANYGAGEMTTDGPRAMGVELGLGVAYQW